MIIKKIELPNEKQKISTSILSNLPEWFGIPESNQEYITESMKMPFWTAYDGQIPVGFIALKENNQYTAEIYVMGFKPFECFPAY